MATVAEANAERWFKEVRGEGREEAEEEAVRLFTAKTFGDDTAATLLEHFKVANDPNRLAKVAEWTSECETGDELLARARQEWGSGHKGRGPSRAKNSKPKNSRKRS